MPNSAIAAFAAIAVIDCGTSALRATLVYTDGAVEPLASEPWPMFVPDDAAPFGREFEAAATDAAFDRLIALIAKQPCAAIAFTGQREGLVFVSEHGDALLISPNIDARGTAEGIAIDAARGDEVYATTGHLPSLIQAAAKYAWLRAHRPDDAARVRWILPLSDWLAMRLTGTPAMSRTLAVENGLASVHDGALATDLLALLDVPLALLPPIVADGTIVGESDQAPLAGIPVVLAGADTQCALVGMGALNPGDCAVPAGWSAPVQLVADAPLLDVEQRTWTGMHVVPQRWILESNAGETGRAWDWLCSTLGVTPAEADALAATATAGARDAMVVLGARVMNAARMSAGVGAITVPLPLVMSAPTRAEMLRATLESTAYAIRANVEQLEAVGGTAIPRLRLGGGMSRSPLFARILCDVLDRPVDVARSPETSSLGAAVLAAATIGAYSSLADALQAISQPMRTHTPDPRASSTYDDCYARWCDMADKMAEMQ